MTIKRINEFPEGSGSLSNDDIFLFMDNPSSGGITKKINAEELRDFIFDDPANLQIRRGTELEVNAITPLEGEPIWVTDTKLLRVGDGLQVGGYEIVSALPSSGLSIEANGSFFSRPQTFALQAPIGIQYKNIYKKYTGKFISSWVFLANSRDTVFGPTSFISFNDLQGIIGNFQPYSSLSLNAISCPQLEYIGGNFNPQDMNLSTLNLPMLTYVMGNFNPNYVSVLTTFSYPSLRVVGGNFNANNLTNATSFSAPLLESVFGSFNLADSPNLNTVSLTSLQEVLLNITFNGLSSLTSISLNNLRYGGGFTANNMPNLTSISLSSIIAFGLGISITSNTSLSTLNIPTDGTLKRVLGTNVTMTNNALNQTSIDNLISALAYLDGNNNTTLFGSGKTVNLTGGTNASPTAISTTTTSGSNFVCSGTTCTVNWSNHGYSSGDVLFISGITTATNANRYALITVVNSNQFTYTIASQTATGSGTATVKKANNNVKALVTRGVTLTTN